MTGPHQGEALFARLFAAVGRRRRAVLGALLLLLGAALWRFPHLKVDSDLETLLPSGPDVVEKLRFLRQSGFSDRVVLSLSLPETEPDPERLAAAVDRLAARLPGPWVTEVSTGLPTGSLVEAWPALLASTPQMIAPERLERWRAELTPGEVHRRVDALYRRLLAPGASMGPLLAGDPLGLAGETLGEFQALSAAFGYRYKASGRHLLSEDERHALLVLRTPAAVPDSFGARALIRHLEACLAGSPDRLQARIIAGHRHTVSNEDAIRGDLRRVAWVAAAGFALLLFGVFRDARAGLVLLAPMVAIVLAIGVASLVFASVSHFLLGMSMVLAGISMDYAIHAYVAQRRIGPEGVRRIARPVLVGGATTAAVFVAFFFSAVPGYAQLALFSILSLCICLAISLLLLPHAIRTDSAPAPLPLSAPRALRPGAERLRVGLWLLCLPLLAYAATRVEFQRDIGQFDGSDESVLRDERAFHDLWGGERQPALLVVEGRETGTVWRAYETVSARAAERLGDIPLVSMAPLWPSRETRVRRVQAWRSFWTERGPALRAALEEARIARGFAQGAFDPFLAWAAEPAEALGEDPPAPALFRPLRERFGAAGGGNVWALAYTQDTPEALRRLAPLERGTGDVRVRILSRGSLSRLISDDIARETARLSALAAVLILVPLVLLTRNLRRSLLALAPVATAVLVLLGVLGLAGKPLTAAALVAGMIMVGLVVDYGVFVVFDMEREDPAGSATADRFTAATRLAIHLSAGTTLVGAGALLRAHHPVMFDIGFTLVVGITAGWLCALFVLPALCRLTRRRAA